MNQQKNHRNRHFLRGQSPLNSKQELSNLLRLVLRSNCQAYSWFSHVDGLIRNRDWPGLYAWADLVPTEVYGTAAEHFAANQLGALVLKYPWDYREIGLEVDPETNAAQKAARVEEKNRRTNRRLRSISYGPYLRPSIIGQGIYRDSLRYMQRWIRHVIGDGPDLTEIFRECYFGPGANIGVHGNATSMAKKLLSLSWSCTPTARRYAISALRSRYLVVDSFLRHEPAFGAVQYSPESLIVCHDEGMVDDYFDKKVRIVDHDNITFVPKKASIHRVVRTQPLLNSYLQNGIGRVLMDRLRRHGYDLSDQGRNSFLAREGSITGRLCTLDLSSASDTLCIELCRLVLPPKWFELMNNTRTPKGNDGIRYEMFASMGNGFCFPLETLVFAAAVRAAIHFSGGSRTHAVYGDDIIVPPESYDVLVRLLAFIGFTPNESKSFRDGPFRESCGADWYEGQDVRPVYLDYELKDDLHRRIFHNATLRSERCASFFSEWRESVYRRLNGKGLLRPQWAERPRKDKSRDLEWFEVASLNGAYSVPFDVFLSSIGAKWNQDEQRWSWLEEVWTASSDTKTEKSDVSHSFRYLTFLSGSPAGRISLRRKARVNILRK